MSTEIVFGLDRQLTVTGGLTFAGGPWDNYVGHSIATMTRVVRVDPGWDKATRRMKVVKRETFAPPPEAQAPAAPAPPEDPN